MMNEASPNSLAQLLDDATIREIMVNGPQQVFVERSGRLEQIASPFATSEAVLQAVEQLLRPLGEALDRQRLTADFRLRDGSAITVVLPPAALTGPCVTIRKAFQDSLTADDLLRFGSLTQVIVDLLQVCVHARLNVLVSGGTGSGKTTVLNILTGFIPADERVVTIEEVAEIQARHEHVVALQSRPADRPGTGAVTVRDLIRTAARLRAERFIFGELPGAEMLDALHLVGRGHDGSMLLIHAASAEEALEQMEMQIVFAQPDLPVLYLRKLFGATLDLVVQQNRLPDGSRKVTAISEVVPDRQRGLTLRDIAVFRQTGVNERGKIAGIYQLYPVSERIAHRLQWLGMTLPLPLMLPDAAAPSS